MRQAHVSHHTQHDPQHDYLFSCHFFPFQNFLQECHDPYDKLHGKGILRSVQMSQLSIIFCLLKTEKKTQKKGRNLLTEHTYYYFC